MSFEQSDEATRELQIAHEAELLMIAVTEAVMRAERAGLEPHEITKIIAGELIIRPGYPQRLMVVIDP